MPTFLPPSVRVGKDATSHLAFTARITSMAEAARCLSNSGKSFKSSATSYAPSGIAPGLNRSAQTARTGMP